MLRRTLVAGVLAAVSPLFALAQRCPNGGVLNVRIQLEGVYHGSGQQLRVQLLRSGGSVQAEAMTSVMGEAQFTRVPSGTYRLRVTGPGVQPTEGLPLSVTCMGADQMEVIRVRTEESDAPSGPGGVVSASQLNIPDKARRELDKGNQAATHQKIEEAIRHFEKAIELFPRYALAHNNLGVLYMKVARPRDGRAAFEKALALDPRCSQAHTNMGKLLMSEKQYAQAEEELAQAVAIDVRGPEGYTLLAMSQLMEGKYTEAADNAHRVHTLGDQGYSVAHFIAGQALRAQRRVQEAMVEYEWYLRETPQGPNAENARKALAELQPADVNVAQQSH
ncbi:MAG TPA: tetratricopeptide repeat protein [Terriglobales bacterium]|nr:tetratricopeptide repeat protein [Terriglobales bacterium]